MRLAVSSPFLDRQHGTETCIIEQIERLADRHDWEIHLYSQRVRNLSGCIPAGPENAARTGLILWHKVPELPGPHLFKFIAWFAANQFAQWRNAQRPALRPDVTYSPGINSFCADVIVVHVVFHEMQEQLRESLRLSSLPLRSWPRTIHRKLYYRLIVGLERRIYRNPRVKLIAVSGLLAAQLRKHFGRSDVRVIPNAVDTSRFSRTARLDRRAAARTEFGFSDREFVLLLIGNGWKNKGLDTLLSSLSQLRGLPFRLLVVGKDDPALYRSVIAEDGLQAVVQFLQPDADVLRFYATADVYVGPSLEDSFGLPILEAMACGLPVIGSVRAGASQEIRHGENGFLLEDPRDARTLADFLRQLQSDPALSFGLGEGAALTAGKSSWDRNAEETNDFLKEVARSKLVSA